MSIQDSNSYTPSQATRPSTVEEKSLTNALKEFKRNLASIQGHRIKHHRDGDVQLRQIHSDGGGESKQYLESSVMSTECYFPKVM